MSYRKSLEQRAGGQTEMHRTTQNEPAFFVGVVLVENF